MVRDINGLGSPPPAEKRSDAGAQKAPVDTAEREQKTTQQSQSTAATRDDVELSSEIKSLKAAEETIQRLADVDEERVAQVKAALENNELKIDNQRLAEKILANDALF